MLQRIQSIYLLLASLAIFALFLFPLIHNANVDGKLTNVSITGVYQNSTGAVYQQVVAFDGLTIATIMIGLVPLVVIFLYKNRKQQVALCYSTLLAIIGYSFWMSQAVKPYLGGAQIDTHNAGIGLLLSSVSMIFIIVAAKAINRDEKLVKSADRLR